MIEKLTLFYWLSATRWAFYGRSGVDLMLALLATCGGLVLCMTAIDWLFKAGCERLELARGPATDPSVDAICQSHRLAAALDVERDATRCA